MSEILRPVLGRDVYIAPTSYVGGDVVIGDQSTVMHHVMIRGDIAPIRIGARPQRGLSTLIATFTQSCFPALTYAGYETCRQDASSLVVRLRRKRFADFGMNRGVVHQDERARKPAAERTTCTPPPAHLRKNDLRRRD
jgi:hypothetical protein